MDSFSRDHREKHLITRGNVDGIVSAAMFLSAFPGSRVTFVTSPNAGARIMAMDRVSSEIYLADLAMVPELEQVILAASERSEVVAFDHHQPHEAPSLNGHLVIREGMSAASVLYHHLGLPSKLRRLVAIADLVEFCDTPLLEEQIAIHTKKRIEEEAKTLDFSWRLDIDDDAYRSQAALHLSQGLWPSEVGVIRRRYLQVVNEQRWPKALARVESHMRIRGPACVLHCKDKNRSLYGFGTRALVEVARDHRCDYAVMVNERKAHSSVSLRCLSSEGINLGRFAEEFTEDHGLEGGGHPTSAGARIPVEETDRFLNDLIFLASR